MASLNEVSLIGNLTRDPELRATSTGKSVANFGLAVNEKQKAQDGWRETTFFCDVECWGKVAENVSRYLHKGSPVYVGGKLKLDRWEDKTTGQKRSKISVVAQNVQFLRGQSEGQNQGQSAGYSQPTQQYQQPQQQNQGGGWNVPPQANNNSWNAPDDLGEPPF